MNEMLIQIERAFADRTESEDRLRRFLADASHELRTPLAAIRGYAELFRLGAVNDRAALGRALARIEAESARMGVLVEDLLLLASLDELPEVRRQAVDLCELVEHAAQDTRAIAPDRKIRVTVNGPLPVLADPDQLRQVMANLTRNALIHTPAGSQIDLKAYGGDGHAVRFSCIVVVVLLSSQKRSGEQAVYLECGSGQEGIPQGLKPFFSQAG